jgi:hypothetical protein
MTKDYAERARALVGTRFRAQGRDETGLDCVGVVLSTFELPATAVRDDYRLRGDHRHEVRQALDLHFRQVARTQTRSGDVLLLSAGADQVHLAVRTPAGLVHAHAGLRRVVETPGMPEWPVLAAYRKRRDR